MNKRVYLVRHGQTVGNVAATTQGPDDPLNEIGLEQARLCAKRVQAFDFECIVSSDFTRAIDTAEAIRTETDKEVHQSELFRELRRPSEFWGKKITEHPEILEAYQQINDNYLNQDWHYSDEENFYDLKTRGLAALEYLLAREEEKILVVTHGNFLRALIGVVLRGGSYDGQDYLDIEATFEAGNTSVSVIEYTHHWRQDKFTWALRS